MAESVWKQRLRAQIAADGRAMKAISLAAGLGETFVADIFNKSRVPSIDNFTALAKALGTTVAKLTEEEKPDSNIVSIMGEVTRRLADIEQDIRAMKNNKK
jgi:transcriptional regulator with XRE-family HTH domain